MKYLKQPYQINILVSCCILLLGIKPLCAQQILCPNNLDFEQGHFANWQFFNGHCCPVVTNNATPPQFGRHELMFGGSIDPYGNFPTVAPGGGVYSLKLGNDGANHQAERARYYVTVPTGPNAYTLIYRYAVVFEDPAHAPIDQPSFDVKVYDSASGTQIVCNSHHYVASSGLNGFKRSGVDTNVWYKEWTTATIDFSGLGGHTVAIDFTTADCGLGAHFGYGYLDLSCALFQVYNVNCKPSPTITLNAPPGFRQYRWTDTAFNNNYGNTESITIPTPNQTKKFAIIVSPFPGFGCEDTLYTTVIISNLITKVSDDTVICKGSTAQLNTESNTIGMPLTYSWSPVGDLSCYTCKNPVASPDTTTMYYVTVTDSTGCTKRDSILVTVRGSVTPDISTEKDTLCTFETVLIENNAVNPPNVTFTWDIDSNGQVISGAGTQKILAGWLHSGLKQVVFKVENDGCKEYDTVYIQVNREPNASVTFPKDVCTGDSILFLPAADSGLYTWYIEEQNIEDSSYVPEYKFLWTTIGKKSVSLHVNALNGCTDSFSSTISVHEPPVADISNYDQNLCKGKTFTVSTTPAPRYEYSWNPPQYFFENNNPQVQGIAQKSGYIHLLVNNQWECVARDSLYIYAGPCCDVFMPDAFTPNGDGINDIYTPIDIQQHQVVEFMIANRWGEIVYQSKEQGAGWDGTYKTQQLPVGTYHYFIRYICYGDEANEKKGNFILLR